MIKNIIFDLGNVIVQGRPSSVLDNLNLDTKTFDLLKSEFFSDWDGLDKGTISLQDKYLSAKIPLDIKNEYEEILVHYYKYRILNEGLINLIHTLKDNNYRVYVLSDINHESIDYMRSHPRFKNIDGWLASCEYGTTKIEKTLFKILFDKYHLDPAECYFIDDKSINVSIGREYGMQGYVYNNDTNELIIDMQKNGILFDDQTNKKKA